MTKKLLLISVSILLALLSACGGGGDNQTAAVKPSMLAAVKSSRLAAVSNTTINCGITATTAAADQSIVGTANNDVLNSTQGNDTIDGLGGLNTVVYQCGRSNYTITKTTNGWTVTSAAEGTDTLANIQRLQFTDEIVALDVDGNAGMAYRIYQAAFNRTPDNEGLKFWIAQLDNGASYQSVAAGFISSAEFQSLYGKNPSNGDFITKLYSNVLHRAPDPAGYAWWLNVLNSNQITQVGALMGFSESAENKSGVSAAIGTGVSLPPLVPVPTVAIFISQSKTTVGTPVTVTWSSSNATSCTASGAWSGTRAVNGTENITAVAIGSYTHTLTCTGDGGSANQNLTVVVDAISQELVCTYVKPATITYPPEYTGVFPMPTPTGRLPTSVVRSMAFLDDYPTMASRYPPANSLCTDQNLYARSLWKESLNRIQQDGATRVWIYNWAGFDDFTKPNWSLTKSFMAMSDSNFQFIVTEAKNRNLEVFYSQQFDYIDIKGNSLNPSLSSDTLIKLMTNDEFRKTLDSYHVFIVNQAKLAQQIGVAGLQVDWAYPVITQILPGLPNYDPEFRTMWLNEMSLIIDDLRAVFTGKLVIGAVATTLDSKIAAKIDAISTTLNIGSITTVENSGLTVDLLKGKYKSLIQQKFNEISNQMSVKAIDLPVMWRVQVQSKYDYYVTQWTESVICGSSPCVQHNYKTDFSVQSIGTEASFEAINEQTYFRNDSVIIDAGYWFNDDMVPRADGSTGFPNLHQSVRNKPAENIVKYWFGR